MKSNKFLLLAVMTACGASCNSGSSDNSNISINAGQVAGLTNGATLPAVSGTNVMTFTVNGSACSNNSYSNKPCVSVTICNPGSTTTCQTVNDILLDTGSYGLRVFKSAIPNLTLTQINSKQGGALTECSHFGGGVTEWGSVKSANVILGGEAAVTIPIQVIEPGFGNVNTGPNDTQGRPTSWCGTPSTDVADAGFNGLLGVGLFDKDCGSDCTWQSALNTNTDNSIYFTCTNGNTGTGSSSTSATCAGGSTTSDSDQVSNPVTSFASDNNGVIIELPTVPSTGANSVNGYMIFGIGTRSNNTPVGLTKYAADGYADMITTYNGSEYDGFFDTGSNGLFFDSQGQLDSCSDGWFCPTRVTPFTFAVRGIQSHATSTNVNIQIGHADSLFNTGNKALNDLGGDGSSFDFGLPFYYGRNIYLGIENKTSTQFGAGPYWAF